MFVDFVVVEGLTVNNYSIKSLDTGKYMLNNLRIQPLDSSICETFTARKKMRNWLFRLRLSTMFLWLLYMSSIAHSLFRVPFLGECRMS